MAAVELEGEVVGSVWDRGVRFCWEDWEEGCGGADRSEKAYLATVLA